MSTTILITGANGFLARAVAGIAGDAWRLIGLVRRGGVTTTAGTRWHGLYDSIDLLCSEQPKVDVVLHLAAWIPPIAGQFAPELIAANVGLPSQLVMRYPQARHVLASSASVYGMPAALPLSAASPVQPCSPYGWSKLAAENLIRTVDHYSILRLSSIIGRDMRAGSFIPTAVAAAQAGSILLRGDGSRTQDYIDVSDAANMCLQAAARQDNFLTLAVSGSAHTNRDVAEQLAGMTGARIQFDGSDDSPSFAYTLADATALGPCRIALQQTLRNMLSE
jgi:nucleoside-diphosphate-sugar epimerase